MTKIYSLMALLLLVFQLICADNASTQTTGTEQGRTFNTEREILRDRSGIDEETRNALVNRLKAIYQPRFHIGLEIGGGMTGSNVPEDHSASPRAGMVINAVSTYYFHTNFALHFSINWNLMKGKFHNLVGDTTTFSLNYLTFAVAPMLHYNDGFFYAGPVAGFKLSANQTIESGLPQIFEPKGANFGFQIGGGWRIDFLYQLRMHVSLEFNYFFLKWLDGSSAKWRPWSIYLKIGILFGIGKLKNVSLD